MPPRFDYIKLYTVAIQKNAAGSGKWYATRVKEQFACILVSRKIGAIHTPVFLVVERLVNRHVFAMPTTILVINPIHTYILYEELLNSLTLKNIEKNYSTDLS